MALSRLRITAGCSTLTKRRDGIGSKGAVLASRWASMMREDEISRDGPIITLSNHLFLLLLRDIDGTQDVEIPAAL